MGFTNMIKGLFSSKVKMGRVIKQYIDTLEAKVPLFRQYGEDLYSSDVFQTCIDAIATEISKLNPQHIRTDPTGMKNTVNSNLNRMLKFGPNELMDTGAFLEQITWLLYLNYNAFIYPTYTETKVVGGTVRTYTGLYPLHPKLVEFLKDETGEMFVRFTFRNGERFTFLYSEIIHLRKKFSVSATMGGDITGQPDNDSIKTTLDVNDVVIQGLEKAIKESLSIRGLLNVKTMTDEKGLQAERERFENAIKISTSGFLAVDLKSDYVPIQREPKLIDKDTLSFIQQKVFNYYGVSMPIITGDYTDAQYEAFYQKTIQPIVMSLSRNFSRILFSPRELSAGNEVVFYQRNLQYLSTASKIQLIEVAGAQGLLMDNEKLEILGYPPKAGGDRITQSLNFVDKSLVNKYQLGKSNQTKKGGQG